MKPRITDIRHHQLAETQREARAKTRIFEPLKSSDFAPVLRPGALDHEKHGSLQPDGSIHPYRKPRCEPSYYQPQALQPRLNNGKFSNG